MRDPYAPILALAAERDGVIAARQVKPVGSVRDLSRLAARGDLVRVRQGAFVLASVWAGATPQERLALRARAVLAERGKGVAAGPSSLALHQVSLWRVDFERVSVHDCVDRMRQRPGLTVLPSLTGADAITITQGAQCATIAYAVTQLCAIRGPEAALVSLDAALHARRVRVDQVAAAIDSGQVMLTAKQRRDCSQMLEQADDRCESVGETRTRMLLRSLGYAPRSQVSLNDATGFVGRVDFLVMDVIVVEFDGMVKYAGADGRSALAAEKRREDRLRAMGLIVVRLTWADLERPGRVAALMNAAVTRIWRNDLAIARS